MAKKDTSYKDLSLEELQDKIVSEKRKLQQLKINHAISVLENPLQIRTIRRSIARMNTEVQKRKTQG